jgi:drug/metabolite transporter (DMT)-like permease
MLLVASAIWGAAFVAQRKVSPCLSAMEIAALRFLAGGLLLLPIVAFRRRLVRTTSPAPIVLRGGLIAGVLMLVAFVLQQMGIERGSTASSAGFITGLYVLFVPMLGLLGGVRTHPAVWAGSLLAAVGLYLLSVTSDFGMSEGDLLVLACAVAWAIHVLVIGRFSPRCDPIELAAMQFMVTGGAALLLLPRWPSMEAIEQVLWPMLYLGPVAVGVAFTLQVVGQRTAPPAHAAVILSLESLFAALFGALLGEERLAWVQYAGCGLMLAGILLAQWPEMAASRPAKASDGEIPGPTGT